MTEFQFRIRVEFDVFIESPSHIDAAFAAADWLQERAAENRFSYLEYEVASTTDLKDGEGTQFKSVDLEEIDRLSDDELPLDTPTFNIADTCCGKCPGATCYVDQITGA